MTKETRKRRLGLWDKAKMNWTIARIDMNLDGRISWRRRREIRNELRSNLFAAAGAHGTRAAISGLGDLRALAAEYADSQKRRVDVRAGWIVTTIAFVVLEMMAFAIHASYMSGYSAAGGSGKWRYSFPGEGWARLFEGSGSQADLSFEVYLFTPLGMFLLASAFVTASRSWRVLSERRSGDAPAFHTSQ